MANYTQTLSNKRLAIIIWLIVIFFVSVLVKTFNVQINKHNSYVKQANNQRERDIRLLANRGYIYDRNRDKFAITTKKDTVFATPYLVEDKDKAAKALSPILKQSRSDIYEKLSKPGGFVFLKRKVNKSTADKIKYLKIEGIDLYKENERSYPLGRNASQLLGFVGMDNEGLSGLELEYDKTLKGRIGRLKDEKDAFGKTIPGTRGQYLKPIDGNSLVLTVDREIQHKAQVELAKAIREFEALSGSVTVINPQTGEIYAMASFPNFNLNNYKKASKESMKNRAVINLYEPGSTLKIIPAASSIAEGVYQSDSSFYLPPTLNVAGKNIKEAHERGAVNFTLSQIVAESSNVGISKVALKLGKKRFYSYLKKFGLLEKTGIDYPGEISGYVAKPEHWYGPTIATIAFGQGIAVTPLQLARAYGAIANGGKLKKPYLVRKVLSPAGKTVKIYKPKTLKKVMSNKASFETILMLEKVVAEGTGKVAQIKGYTVAGKTGTAQKPKVGEKGYGNDYVSSFIGFAPAENAKVLTLVVVDSPTKGYYGSQVAAPAFKEITEFNLQQLSIPPE